MADNITSQPLLRSHTNDDSPLDLVHQPSRTSRIAAYSLAGFRLLVGVTCMVAPTPLRQVFIPGEQSRATSTFLPRLVGARELAIGALLWAILRRKCGRDCEDIRRVLWANMAVDLMDTISAAVIVVATTAPERVAAAWFGAGALLFVLLACLSLHGH
ncbi:hypothetical protein ACJZ2D_006733 [Fusarium nematophilum]